MYRDACRCDFGASYSHAAVRHGCRLNSHHQKCNTRVAESNRSMRIRLSVNWLIVFNSAYGMWVPNEPSHSQRTSAWRNIPAYHTDPTVVYTAKHPFLTTRLEEHSHTQIADKAFEDNACAALEHHLQSRSVQRRIPDNFSRPGSWRYLTLAGGKDVAEWEGIWESSDGHIFFLEAKHLMNLASLCQFYCSVSVLHVYI